MPPKASKLASKKNGFKSGDPGKLHDHPHVQPPSQKISELQEKLTENFDERRQLIELCDKMEAKYNANLQLEKQHSEKMRWVKKFTTDCTTEQMTSLLQTISSKTHHIT